MFSEPVGPEKTLSTPPPPEPSPDRNETLFHKAATIWLWSIFFGLNAGISASYAGALGTAFGSMMMQAMMPGAGGFNQGTAGPIGEAIAFAVPFSYLGGILATLGSWYYLYSFFSRVLLPTVFDTPLTAGSPRSRAAMRNLRSVYFWVLAAGVLRYIPEFLLHLAPVINRVIGPGGPGLMPMWR
jgi:hypothetical protein